MNIGFSMIKQVAIHYTFSGALQKRDFWFTYACLCAQEEQRDCNWVEFCEISLLEF